MTVFITGDRMMSAAYLPLVALEVMRALAAGETIVTGDSETGVEAIVRDFAQRAEFEVGVVEWGANDWDARHKYLQAQYDLTEIVAVHAQAEQSSVVRSLFTVFTDDNAVRLVTPMDLLV